VWLPHPDVPVAKTFAIADYAEDATTLRHCAEGTYSSDSGRLAATGDIALHLGIAETADVIKKDRVIETVDGKPIERRVAFCKAL
jgi:hypothetical protein